MPTTASLPLPRPPYEMSSTDAAALLGVGERHIRLLIERGQLAGRKIGNTYIVRGRSVERYRRERKRPGRPKGNGRKPVEVGIANGE